MDRKGLIQNDLREENWYLPGTPFSRSPAVGGHFPARGTGNTLTTGLRKGLRGGGMGGRGGEPQSEAAPWPSARRMPFLVTPQAGSPAESRTKQMIIDQEPGLPGLLQGQGQLLQPSAGLSRAEPPHRDLISFAWEGSRLVRRGPGWPPKDITSPSTRGRAPEVIQPKSRGTLLNPVVPTFMWPHAT